MQKTASGLLLLIGFFSFFATVPAYASQEPLVVTASPSTYPISVNTGASTVVTYTLKDYVNNPKIPGIVIYPQLLTGSGGTTSTAGIIAETGGTCVNGVGYLNTCTIELTYTAPSSVPSTNPAATSIVFGYEGRHNIPAQSGSFAISAVSITSLSLSSGPTTGGQTLTITGSGLASATSVTFGGNAATIKTRSDTSIKVETPSGSLGSVDVIVTTSGGSATGTNAYTYYQGNGYVLNQSSRNISVCPITDTTSGAFGTCATTTAGVTFNALFGLAENQSATFLYLSDWDNQKVYYCPLNNGVVGTCVAGVTTIANPDGVAINPAGTILYVADVNHSASIYSCPIAANGSIASCSTTGNGFNQPLGVAINSAGTIAYVINTGNNTVSQCLINLDGTFGTCATTGNGFSIPGNIAINPEGTIAYVTNAGNDTVSQCPINLEGTFGTCATTGNGFNVPIGLAINPEGTIAYVTNAGNDTVSQCPINLEGTFGTCATTGNGFSGPIGIAVRPSVG